MTAAREAIEWLERRTSGAPAALVAHARDALALTTAPTVTSALAEAALSCLRRAIELGGDRAAALELLAADALLTHACEAAAAEGPQTLAALTDSLSPDGLERMLSEARRS